MTDATDNAAEKLSPIELVQLGATDPLFFAHTFFPKAFRQQSPAFHRQIWETLENPAFRNVAVAVFRGGAKTTLLRTFTARRICYGLSRTILFVSEAQDHAVKSIEWMQNAVKFNPLWARTFGLRPGAKWTGEDIEILHGAEGHTIRVLARGITGQNRGVNVDDYRPDLIVVDDPNDEENTATPEQRKKTADIFFGALGKSLAPSSENPHAKMVLLQTPLHREDLLEVCLRDPSWHGLRFGCFDESGESIWPTRFPTEELLREKATHVRLNKLSLWMREMECKVTSEETSAFKNSWLKFYDTLPPLSDMAVYMAIDPAPPLSEESRLRGRHTDFQAFAVVGFYKNSCYLLDYTLVKDQNPEETATEFFALASKWRPRVIGVESVAYQRTLAHYLREKMRQTGRYYVVQELQDRRKKADRIRQALSGRAANGEFYVHNTQVEFVQQFSDYPDVKNDDLLDAVSMAISLSTGYVGEGAHLEGEFKRIEQDERNIPDLSSRRFAL